MKRIKIFGSFGKSKKIKVLKEEKENLISRINELEERKKADNDKLFEQLEMISILHDTINNDCLVIDARDKKIDKLLEKIEKSETVINTIKKNHEEYVKKVKAERNELKKEIKTLKKQLEESMSDKYRVVKLPSGKTPKGQTSKIKKSTSTKASVRNYIKNELEIMEEE